MREWILVEKGNHEVQLYYDWGNALQGLHWLKRKGWFSLEFGLGPFTLSYDWVERGGYDIG